MVGIDSQSEARAFSKNYEVNFGFFAYYKQVGLCLQNPKCGIQNAESRMWMQTKIIKHYLKVACGGTSSGSLLDGLFTKQTPRRP